MIGPIDPTGRADRHANRKLFRLLGLLCGVFVVGTGIGWIVGQIGRPTTETGSQNVATTLPASLPPPVTAPVPDALAPPPAPAPEPAPAPPVPQPATATPTDQHAATNFIAEATQQPPPAPPVAPSSPVKPSVAPAPVPPVPVPPSSPSPSTSAKSEPEVVFEPAQEPVAPPEAAKPAAPTSTPVTKHPHVAKEVKHRAAPHAAKHHAAETASRVTVIGAKAAPAGTRWAIQLGAFRTHDHAALLVMTLQSHGTVAKVIKRDDGAKGIWYIVQTPGVASLKAATTAAAGISRRERLAATVMRAGK